MGVCRLTLPSLSLVSLCDHRDSLPVTPSASEQEIWVAAPDLDAFTYNEHYTNSLTESYWLGGRKCCTMTIHQSAPLADVVQLTKHQKKPNKVGNMMSCISTP